MRRRPWETVVFFLCLVAYEKWSWRIFSFHVSGERYQWYAEGLLCGGSVGVSGEEVEGEVRLWVSRQENCKNWLQRKLIGERKNSWECPEKKIIEIDSKNWKFCGVGLEKIFLETPEAWKTKLNQRLLGSIYRILWSRHPFFIHLIVKKRKTSFPQCWQ